MAVMLLTACGNDAASVGDVNTDVTVETGDTDTNVTVDTGATGTDENMTGVSEDADGNGKATDKVASADDMVTPEEVVEEGMEPVYGDSIKDGAYEVTVDSSSSMFNIESCQLTVADGKMSAVMTMGGTGYLYLYMGTAEEAAAASEADYISFVENAEGKHTFEVPVEALDAGIDCAAFSKKKEMWYDRQLCFRADSLPMDAIAEGAVTVGSEMAGGVNNLIVEKCRFYHTDRGLRIKTRRGRGKDAILDNIIFRDLEMEQVMTPFTANAFYFCDPDGRTEFVQSREPYPVDDGTPSMKRFCFENITANDCHVAASYFDGLPEQKIEQITMRNVSVSFAEQAKCDVPIMSNGVEACCKKGLYARNVKKLVLDNVSIEGCEGEGIELHDVDEVER